MPIEIRLPHITDGSDRSQIEQIKKFLFQHCEQLQYAFNTIADDALNKSDSELGGDPAEDFGVVDATWRPLGLSDGVTDSEINIGRNGSGSYYRVDGRHIYVTFNCAISYKGSSIKVNKSSIPSKYRPKRDVSAIVPAGSDAMIKVRINTGGNISVDQVYFAAESSVSNEISWIDGYLDYWV
jgi:hypothetical protein